MKPQLSLLSSGSFSSCAMKYGAALILTAASAMPAVANPTHIEKHFKVDPNAHPVISIHNPGGTITVKAWTRPEVRLTSDCQSDKVEVDAEQNGNRVDLTVRPLAEGVSPDDMHADFEIFVPESTELQIHNDSGKVMVNDVMGDMAVDTVEAGVDLEDAAGYLSIKTVGGSVQCTHCAGRVEITSITGSVKLVDLRSYNVRAQTSAGDIFFDGEFMPNGTYRLKNYTGTIEVRFSPADSFNLSAASVKGKVNNEANLSYDNSRPPRKSNGFLTGKLGTGSARVELSSFDGTINIHRREP
jgi:DUF4097 and DUF4098 domain-containing protein YvlB